MQLPLQAGKRDSQQHEQQISKGSSYELQMDRDHFDGRYISVYDAETYANLSPSPLVVKLEYSHPTLSPRIDAIRKLQS